MVAISADSFYLLCCIVLCGASMVRCQTPVGQAFDVFVVKIHTTKLIKGKVKRHPVNECNFLGVFEDLQKYQHFKDTKFVVYGNNAPVGSSRAAGEVDFLQYRIPDEDFTEPIYPILVEIITMLDKSELKLDDQEIYMIKSCVKKHVKIIKSDIRIKYMFIIQANDGSLIEDDPPVDPMYCNFE